jgi:hypothetical protein
MNYLENLRFQDFPRINILIIIIIRLVKKYSAALKRFQILRKQFIEERKDLIITYKSVK